MSITIVRNSDSLDDTSSMAIIINGRGNVQAVRQLVQRGANLWPDAVPEIKEFADKMTVGVVLQDYKTQAGKE